MVLLIINPGESLGKFLLYVPETLCFVSTKVLVPEEGRLVPGDTTVIPLNWKLILPLDKFGFLMPLNKQAKRELCFWQG